MELNSDMHKVVQFGRLNQSTTWEECLHCHQSKDRLTRIHSTYQLCVTNGKRLANECYRMFTVYLTIFSRLSYNPKTFPSYVINGLVHWGRANLRFIIFVNTFLTLSKMMKLYSETNYFNVDNKAKHPLGINPVKPLRIIIGGEIASVEMGV